MGIANRGTARNPKRGEIRACPVCGKEKYVPKGELDKLSFCSHKCQVTYFLPNRTGSLHKWYKGGTSITINKRTGMKYETLLGEGKGVKTHRKIASDLLGRPLKPNEVVHHIDGNGLNNSNSNLLICSRSYHVMLHHKMEGGLRHHAG
jgi:hypothetical protein